MCAAAGAWCFGLSRRSELHNIKGGIAIAVLSLAPALANAGPKDIGLTANQHPSVAPVEMAPIQPLYESVAASVLGRR